MLVKSAAIEAPLAELQAQLTALQEANANHFNPVRFSYLEAMLARLHAHREGVSRKLQARVDKALTEYRSDFGAAKEVAKVSLEQGVVQFPQASEQLYQFFKGCKFQEMKRLLLKLEQGKQSVPLAELTAYVSRPESALEGKKRQTPTFDDILRQQENRLVNTVGNSVVATDSSAPKASVRVEEGELDTIHYFRESLVKRNADKRVTQAIKEIPQDAGPLNPQKLIVQSLSSMRDLSPHYLNRFVAYIDTLLWLDKAGRK